MVRMVKGWGPVLIWMALIFFFSSRPTLPSAGQKPLDFLLKKSAHMGVFAVLTILVARALTGEKKTTRRILVKALLFAGLYALSDEFHQGFVPGRTPRLMDVLFDWSGALAGAWVWRRWLRGDQQVLKRLLARHDDPGKGTPL